MASPDPDFENIDTKISPVYTMALAVCFLALTLLLLWPGLKAPMVYDSRVFIADKAEVFAQKGLSGAVALYPGRPLAMASFYLNYVFTGMNPLFFRLVNICILVGCAIIVFILLNLMLSTKKPQTEDAFSFSRAIGTLLALIYLVHPLQIFLSLYIYQRMALMSCFCFLSALALYMGTRSRMVRSEGIGYCMVFILYQIGMFSKPNIFILPLILLLAEIAFFKSSYKELLKRATAFLLATIPYFVIMKMAVSAPEGISAPGTGFLASIIAYYDDSGIKLKELALTNCRVLFSYLYAIFVPSPSNVQLLQAQVISRSLTEPPSTLVAFLGVLALGGFGLAMIKRRPMIGFGITFFLVTIVPESFLVPQYLYVGYRPLLPMTGIMFVAADLLWSVAMKVKDRAGTNFALKAVSVTVMPLIFFLAAVTGLKASLWSDQLLFWRQTLEVFPSYGPNVEKKAYLDTLLNIGDGYCEIGRWADAAHSYRRALEIEPEFAMLHNNLGLALHEMGETDTALRHLNRAIALNPQMTDAYNNAGLVFFKIGDTDKAIEYFNKAIALNPQFTDALSNLGTVFINVGRLSDAVNILSKAVEIQPDSAQAHNNLGFAYYRLGNTRKAIEHFKKALQIEPDFQKALENLRRASARQP